MSANETKDSKGPFFCYKPPNSPYNCYSFVLYSVGNQDADPFQKSDDEDDEDEEDEEKVPWVACEERSCKKWYHQSCALKR